MAQNMGQIRRVKNNVPKLSGPKWMVHNGPKFGPNCVGQIIRLKNVGQKYRVKIMWPKIWVK